jgi:hypothetical protein
MMKRALVASILCLLVPWASIAQEVPSPQSHFGFEIGSNRNLANWDALTSYYEALARTSPRIAVDTLGATTMDRPFVMLTITSPENHARLDELHEIQMKLADPRRVESEAELEGLIADGKTVVLITHQIHATEVGGGQAAARLAHRMASSTDPRVQEILDNVIFLQIPSLNPDGLQWVADWYNEYKGTEYEGANLPWLYHFYVGHDNNRDWFTFAQVETQHTITKAHNAWHPQIVHDIHQMGGNGARIFFPPYIDPIEPNVDPGLVTAVNQLGAYMAAELTADGKPGVVINAIYDGFHPGRAYQHYLAGARILSETASARLATPVEVPREQVRGGREYEAYERSWKFPWPWEGGEWGLEEIVDYMDSGAMALLTNAAKNREYWLRNFYAINKRAVDKWEQWPEAWVIPADQTNKAGLSYLMRTLTMGDVEVRRAERPFHAGGWPFPEGTYVIPMRQPYASFAQTLLEVQEYPDLREYPGGPPKRPYDVTGHTLPLLMDVEAVSVDQTLEVPLSDPLPIQDWDFELPEALRGADAPRIAMYKSWGEPMIAGWTRWVFDQHGLRYDTIGSDDVRAGNLADRYDVIVLQSQDAQSILEGYGDSGGFRGAPMPPAYRGGIGDQGAGAIRDFVESGGRLVAIEESTDFAIDLFDLPIRNAVDGLSPQDFYIPGSILRLEMAEREADNIAWYWRSSRAFDVSGDGVEIHARYGQGDPLLSGWVLGGDRIAGRPALVSSRVGSGEVVLFAFQPNYRSQSVATWPLLWEALAARRGMIFE